MYRKWAMNVTTEITKLSSTFAIPMVNAEEKSLLAVELHADHVLIATTAMVIVCMMKALAVVLSVNFVKKPQWAASSTKAHLVTTVLLETFMTRAMLTEIALDTNAI
jgi:hypothetical protein